MLVSLRCLFFTFQDIKTAQLMELTQCIRDSASHYSFMGILNHCHTHGGVRLLRANILEPPCLFQTIIKRLDCVQEIVENPELFKTLEVSFTFTVYNYSVMAEFFINLFITLPATELYLAVVLEK